MPVRLAVALAVVGLAVLGTPDAHAADPAIARVGWWTRSPSASAPDGGVVVGTAADGPESVAAIEIDLGDGATDASIELAEAGGSLQDAAAILVCGTDESWETADGGELAEAPQPDCADGVPLARDESGSWRADVGALLAGRTGLATLVLVPAPSPMPIPGVVVPFEVELEQPVLTSTATPTTSTPPGPRPTSGFGSPATSAVPVQPPPAITAPATTVDSAPEAAPTSPTVAALGVEDVRRVWRWGLWLRIVLVGTLAGVVAGVGRWKLISRWQTTAP